MNYVILTWCRGWIDSTNDGSNTSYFLYINAWYYLGSAESFNGLKLSIIWYIGGIGYFHAHNVNNSGGVQISRIMLLFKSGTKTHIYEA